MKKATILFVLMLVTMLTYGQTTKTFTKTLNVEQSERLIEAYQDLRKQGYKVKFVPCSKKQELWKVQITVETNVSENVLDSLSRIGRYSIMKMIEQERKAVFVKKQSIVEEVEVLVYVPMK